MNRKLIISESDKKRILEMYGLLLEEGTRCDFINWQNGDGKTKPKVEVTKTPSEFKVTFNGPETGFCIQHKEGSTGDTIHQTTAVAKVVLGEYLKELYNSGNYVYPDINNIIIKKADKFLEVIIPLLKMTEDKAATSFDGRGGWGHTAEKLVTSQKNALSDKSRFVLVKFNKQPIIANGGSSPFIAETFVAYRDIKDFPIKTKPSPVDDKEKNKVDVNKKDDGDEFSDAFGTDNSNVNTKKDDGDEFSDAFGAGGPNVNTKKEDKQVVDDKKENTTTDYQLDTPEKIQEFQTWMDGKYGEWAYSKKYKTNYKVGRSPKLGYGTMGPNTTREWKNKKEEYLKEKGLK